MFIWFSYQISPIFFVYGSIYCYCYLIIKGLDLENLGQDKSYHGIVRSMKELRNEDLIREKCIIYIVELGTTHR